VRPSFLLAMRSGYAHLNPKPYTLNPKPRPLNRSFFWHKQAQVLSRWPWHAISAACMHSPCWSARCCVHVHECEKVFVCVCLQACMCGGAQTLCLHIIACEGHYLTMYTNVTL